MIRERVSAVRLLAAVSRKPPPDPPHALPAVVGRVGGRGRGGGGRGGVPPRGQEEHRHMSLLRKILHEEQTADEPRVPHEAHGQVEAWSALILR